MAMDIVAMLSYIYYCKSVVQVRSPRGKVWGWNSGLGLNMPSRYILAGVHYQISLFNNARRAFFNYGI